VRPFSAIVHAPKCAGCNKVKQHSNSWWQAELDSGSGKLLLGPLNDEPYADGKKWYLCGQECVGKVVKDYMDTILKSDNMRT
jgi:hypothetical protein